MPFIINGETCHFHGTVTIVSADNPASTSLGGFKETAAAFRFYRHCTGTEDVQSMVLNDDNNMYIYPDSPLYPRQQGCYN